MKNKNMGANELSDILKTQQGLQISGGVTL